jgi:hypothetical protein
MREVSKKVLDKLDPNPFYLTVSIKNSFRKIN